MPTVEILSQGDEVVTGQTVDTNAAWLSDRLTALGLTVVRHTAVGDRMGDIQDVVAAARTRVDVVVSTGGLGPTEDDLTTAAVASVYGVEPVFDPVAMAHIEALYARYGRPMPEVNRKQAVLPDGCIRLDNHWGTAPAFAMEDAHCVAFFLPGVPREMRSLFDAHVLPRISERFDLVPGRLVTLRTTGIGESNLQERIGTYQVPGVTLSYRTRLPENHIKLRFDPDVSDTHVVEEATRVAGLIGNSVFCIEGLLPAQHPLASPTGELEEVVVQLLVAGGHTVATAESCTGGRVAAKLTAVPGSSAAFLEAAVTYSNAAKVRLVGVEQSALDAHDAVSEPVAIQMAAGVRERAGTAFGLSTTGIAGPGGGSEDKPVGTVHIALATPDRVHHRKLRLGGNRSRIQSLATAAVLDLLRRHLQGVLPSSP